MGFGSKITHCPVGKEDPITSSKEITEGLLAPDGSRIVQILTDCELGWCMDGKDAMASVIHQVLENFRENSIYMDDGKG